MLKLRCQIKAKKLELARWTSYTWPLFEVRIYSWSDPLPGLLVHIPQVSSKKSRIPVELYFGNQTASDTQSKANLLNKFSHPGFLQAQTPPPCLHMRSQPTAYTMLSVTNLAKCINYSLSIRQTQPLVLMASPVWCSGVPLIVSHRLSPTFTTNHFSRKRSPTTGNYQTSPQFQKQRTSPRAQITIPSPPTTLIIEGPWKNCAQQSLKFPPGKQTSFKPPIWFQATFLYPCRRHYYPNCKTR